MPVDPSNPDTFEDTHDVYEDTYGDAYEDEPEGGEERIEAPREDAAEQHTELLVQHRAPITGRDDVEVDPDDVATGARVVELNEDEYR
ncbi:hypothetical protein LHJ74_18665 [Streptomyces sp. N2-109]|uniref:DUF5709 domain-containing protein n=1 Tax=Streptomyces gossypii TaxID=2883101 RepID=A0ABT2JVG6_9ACTN|nr:hypothetical protein [Streptomyces gossypii]MCT2591897.1 hypothetical protein [Streptomyces gossypii]